MKKKILTIFLAGAMAVCSLSACGGSNNEIKESAENNNESNAETYSWKLVHEELPDGDEDIYCHAFKDIIEKKSEGRIQIQVFTMGQLGDGANQCELVQSGAIELGVTSPGALAPLAPEMNLFGLQYAFPTEIDEVWELLSDGRSMELMKGTMKNYGLTVLDFLHQGPYWWTSNKELRNPDDWKGVKWRTQASAVEMAGFDAYGANSTTVPFAELYTALQLGMVEGQQQPNRGNNLMKFYEVNKIYTDPRSAYYVYMPFTSSSFYDGLPGEIQKMVEESFLEARSVMIEDLSTSMDREKQKAIDNGVTWIELTDEEKAVFAELARSARDKYLEVGGPKAKEILDALDKDMEKYQQ